MRWDHIQDPDYAWRQGERGKPPVELRQATSHKLKHDPFTSRWSCACGYVLGDGREAFLALCPLVRDLQQAARAIRRKKQATMKGKATWTKKSKHIARSSRSAAKH